jgi:hypothetical protein
MSVVFIAPHVVPETSITLPNPKLSNSEGLLNSLNLQRSMNGTRRTFVKVTPDVLLRMEFDLERTQVEMVYQFIKYYSNKEVRLIYFDGKTYRGYILSNPLQIQFKNATNSADVLIEFRGRLYE